MKSAIYMDGKRFIETEFKTEEDFERVVKEHSKTLFGAKTIFSDLKNKIDSRTLGSSVPDGFLFDVKDEENPEFYLVDNQFLTISYLIGFLHSPIFPLRPLLQSEGLFLRESYRILST